MAGRGFIHDKLELKFLILYITARVIEPIPFDTVLDLTMCDDAIDYFDFSECLADLVRTEHLSLSEDGLYSITGEGAAQQPHLRVQSGLFGPAAVRQESGQVQPQAPPQEPGAGLHGKAGQRHVHGESRFG